MRRLTAAEVRRRRAIAARDDLSRAEQARLVGMSPQSWRQTLVDSPDRYGFKPRAFDPGRKQIRERRLHGEGMTYRVQPDHGEPKVTLYGTPMRALGLRPGERVRVRYDKLGRRLIVEAVRG